MWQLRRSTAGVHNALHADGSLMVSLQGRSLAVLRSECQIPIDFVLRRVAKILSSCCQDMLLKHVIARLQLKLKSLPTLCALNSLAIIPVTPTPSLAFNEIIVTPRRATIGKFCFPIPPPLSEKCLEHLIGDRILPAQRVMRREAGAARRNVPCDARHPAMESQWIWPRRPGK